MKMRQQTVSWAPDNKVIPNNLIPTAVTSAGKKKQQAAKDDLLETKVVPSSDRFLPSVIEASADGRTKAPTAGACGATCDIRNSPNRILKIEDNEKIVEGYCLPLLGMARRLMRDASFGPRIYPPRIITNPKMLLHVAKILEHKKRFTPLAVDFKSCQELLEAAEKGNMAEFQRLLAADERRMQFRDSRGRQAIHHAASHDRINILEFILSRPNAELRPVDNEGNTPLHSACTTGAAKAIAFFIQHDPEQLECYNKENQSPLHLATQLNKVASLTALCDFKSQIDVEQKSKHGRTALHLACISDHADAALILLRDFGASPKTTCDNGFYPIHEAAKNASANAMRALLEFCESIGIPRAEMMKLFDADGNVPLHSAVHAGDLKAVELCLESGALISTQQHDLSTPVHLACSQGAMDIVKLMFRCQPDQKMGCLTCSDAQNMIPLHCAAMFDHVDLVNFLVDEGASLNATDKEGRSVLLLAAARSAWKTVASVLKLGADLGLQRDNQRRNLLHHIVLSGGSIEEFTLSLNDRLDEFIQLLNERDTYGCTALHYAARNGQLKSIQSLITLGASVNLKNNDNQSPLHFAAMFGRLNTVRHLLDSKKGHLIINEMDGQGKTPLHIASQCGHVRVVHLLLVKGALLHRDHKGRTPLHYAAMNGYNNTMDQLLAVHSHLLDQTDRDGNTALHMAAMKNRSSTAVNLLNLSCKITKNGLDMTPMDYALHCKHSEVAMAMVTHPIRSDEIMTCQVKAYGCLVEGLTAVMPEVMMTVLDRGISKSKMSHDSEEYFIMVRYGREELLSHPLSVKYLETKWNAYGMYFHILNLMVYTVFLGFLTLNAVQLMQDNKKRHHGVSGLEVADAFARPSIRTKYFVDVMNILEWTLYLASGLMALSQLTRTEEKSYQNIVAALAVFLAWFNYLLFLQRFNRVGLYVVMFLEILSTLLRVVMVFSVLIIAFGLSFHILLARVELSLKQPVLDARTGNVTFKAISLSDKGFHSPLVSLIRVGTMMLGEIDFLGTYLRPLRNLENSTWYQIVTATLFLVAFIILMPILLMNLLIGLAVGDIETVRRNAQLKRLTMQVRLHTDLERKLPKKILEAVDRTEMCIYPNQKGTGNIMWRTIKRWFGSPRNNVTSGGGGGANGKNLSKSFTQQIESNINEIQEQLSRQKDKIREISKNLELQLTLVRLLVSKMEIKSEAEELDEGEFNSANLARDTTEQLDGQTDVK
ncbi:transient receptor potential cation channel subfamily A member 1-like [Tropilaelaps mercedesae]|uniref:Transient receptor potential cation channel subfamily A member 1-like n=1 Tax=Tropilaelaps mercedesae TaxID=418985 RepID=A0A1V9XR59_9ACAR|nr:transient receptor potential cation channel subfamily A member 1-like [Tropilaelaps mercedesae]